VRFLRHASMWHHLGFGFWAVEEKATGSFIGEGGFHELKRDVKPSLEGTLEAGWAFIPRAHGKGLATELVAAVLAWAAQNHPGKPVTAMIDPGHARSIRVAEKSGFVERARTQYGGEPVVLFDHRP